MKKPGKHRSRSTSPTNPTPPTEEEIKLANAVKAIDFSPIKDSKTEVNTLAISKNDIELRESIENKLHNPTGDSTLDLHRFLVTPSPAQAIIEIKENNRDTETTIAKNQTWFGWLREKCFSKPKHTMNTPNHPIVAKPRLPHEYDFAPLSSITENTLLPGTFYAEMRDDTLHYSVLNPKNIPVTDTISKEDLEAAIVPYKIDIFQQYPPESRLDATTPESELLANRLLRNAPKHLNKNNFKSMVEQNYTKLVDDTTPHRHKAKPVALKIFINEIVEIASKKGHTNAKPEDGFFKSTLKTIGAFMLSLTPTMSALLALSGANLADAVSNPKQFWINWWDNLTFDYKSNETFQPIVTLFNKTFLRGLSIKAAQASLAINIGFNRNITANFMALMKQLKTSIIGTDSKEQPSWKVRAIETAKSAIYLGLGAMCGVSFCVIAYENYAWVSNLDVAAGINLIFSSGTTYTIAAMSFLSYFLVRALFTGRFIDNLTHYKIANTQKIIIDLIRNTAPEYKNELQKILDSDNKFDIEENFLLLASSFVNLVKDNPNLLASPTYLHHLKSANNLLVTALLTMDAVTIGTLTTYLLAYKTRVGEGEIISDMNTWNTFSKLLLGLTGGIPSGLAYYMGTNDFYTLLPHTYRHLKAHPEKIREYLMDMANVALSALSMWYVAYNFPDKNDFYQPPFDIDLQKIFFAVMVSRGCGHLNAIPTLNKYSDPINIKSNKIEDIIRYFENPSRQGRRVCELAGSKLELCHTLFKLNNRATALVSQGHLKDDDVGSTYNIA